MVVVVGAVVGVVVVTLPAGALVLVVVVAPVVVVVVLDAPVVEVVEVVDVDVGVVVGAGGGLTMFFSVVPVSAPPKIADRGLPEISSTAVMSSSASTNTTATVPAMPRQENPGRAVRRPTDGGVGGVVVARSRWVAGVSAVAEISKRSVSAAGASVDAISTVSGALPPDRPTTSVGAEDASTEDAD